MKNPLDEILALTMDLIRYRSTADRSDAIEACVDHVSAWLAERGVACERLAAQGAPSLLVAGPRRTAPMLLLSHLDVVDGPDALFEPRLEDGWLHGRGAVDDKYAVALSCVLHVHMRRELGCEQNPLGLLITSDEEVGGVRGAGALLGEVRTEFCIALDGGSVDEAIGREKGFINCTLTTRGKAAHGARPWLGENAVDAFVEDYMQLKRLFMERQPGFWHRTINLGSVQAGDAVNTVPEQAVGRFNIRYTETDDPEELIEAMRSRVRGDLQVDLVGANFESGDSPYLELLRGIHPGLALGQAHGASDARHLKEHGIPGLVWGAEGAGSQHSQRERVEVASIERLYGYLAELCRRAAQRA